MYRHLLVPVDGSKVSAANIDAALSVARGLAAKVTFFHAAPDLAATAENALLRVMAPDDLPGDELADARAILAKAEVCADAVGVPCSTLAIVSDRPAEAIVETAVARGCDLIVMGTRGRRGIARWSHGSQAEGVLKASPVALLVTRIEANAPLDACERALAVIHDEHRSVAVVLRAMRELVRDAGEAGATLDVRSLEMMLAYMQAFPLRLHHPKEERYLHRALRLRAPHCAQLLSDIEVQHAQEHARVERLIAALAAVAGGGGGAAEVARQVHALADGVWQHMGLEEHSILPLARQHLAPSDWPEIAEAFERNDDPGFGSLAPEEFQRLFVRIANLLPAAGSVG